MEAGSFQIPRECPKLQMLKGLRRIDRVRALLTDHMYQ